METLSPENRRELVARYYAQAEKRRYYLLAAAGTSAGFTVTQMNDLTPSPTNWLLVISLGLIGLSLMMGMRSTSLSMSLTQGEVVLSDFVPKPLPGVSDSSIKDHIRTRQLDTKFQSMQNLDSLQAYTLILGGFLVPIWSFARCDSCSAHLWHSAIQFWSI